MSSKMNWKEVKAEAEFFYRKHRQLLGRCVNRHLQEKKNMLTTLKEEISELEDMLTNLRSVIQEELTTELEDQQQNPNNVSDRIRAILSKLRNNKNAVKNRIETVSERLREQHMELEDEAQEIEQSSKRIAKLEQTENTDQ